MKKILFALLILSSALQAQIIRGPYLQSPTANSIVVMWRSSANNDSRVVYGTDANNLSLSVTDAGSVTNHSISLTGLQPNTVYYYAVGTTTQLLSGPDSLHRFKTPPVIGTVQPFTVWAIGDFGKGNDAQREVREAFEDYNTGFKTDFWIWLGDNVYDEGTDEEYSTKVFNDGNGYKTVMQYLPFLPCPGNHDYGVISNPVISTNPTTHNGPYFDLADVFTNGECGGVPSNTELYYSYDYANTHFVSVNSELASVFNQSHDWIGASPLFSFSGSPFTQWLEADLAANTKTWTVVYFHQPPHTDGSHDSDQFWEVNMQAMRENISPIFEQYGVDLVLSGHSHVYERSYLINGFFDVPGQFNASQHIVSGASGNETLGEQYVKYTQGPNANKGTIYNVCGNAASKDDNPALQHPAMYYSEGCDTCLGSVILKIHGDTLRSFYLTAYGEIKDQYTIYKVGQPNAVTETPSALINFAINPNPAYKSFKVTVELSKENPCRLELYNMQGQMVKNLCTKSTLTKGVHEFTFDTATMGIAPGFYLIKFADGGKVYTRRLIVAE